MPEADIDDIVDISDDSDVDDAEFSTHFEEELAEKAQHLSTSAEWCSMSLAERTSASEKFENEKKRLSNKKRRQELKAQLEKEQYDSSLKPRTSAKVTIDLGISLGNIFASRQAFQLRVSEVCNHLNKMPVWSSAKNDPQEKKAECNSGACCARSVDTEDSFIARAMRTPAGWKVVDLNLSQASRRASLLGKTRRLCAFTAKQLSFVILSFVQIDRSLAANVIQKHLALVVGESHVSPSLVEKARKIAQNVVFSVPKDKVKYLPAFVAMIDDAGHACELQRAPYKDAKRVIFKILRWEHQQSEQSTMPSETRVR